MLICFRNLGLIININLVKSARIWLNRRKAARSGTESRRSEGGSQSQSAVKNIISGSNEIDNVSAMNVTEVINTTTPGPEPTPTPTPEPTPVPGPEPSPEPSSEPVVNKMVSTGNPLGLFVVSLFTILIGGLKRKI